MLYVPSEIGVLVKSEILGESSLSVALFPSNELILVNVLVVGIFSPQTSIHLPLIKCSQVSKK